MSHSLIITILSPLALAIFLVSSVLWYFYSQTTIFPLLKWRVSAFYQRSFVLPIIVSNCISLIFLFIDSSDCVTVMLAWIIVLPMGVFPTTIKLFFFFKQMTTMDFILEFKSAQCPSPIVSKTVYTLAKHIKLQSIFCISSVIAIHSIFLIISVIHILEITPPQYCPFSLFGPFPGSLASLYTVEVFSFMFLLYLVRHQEDLVHFKHLIFTQCIIIFLGLFSVFPTLSIDISILFQVRLIVASCTLSLVVFAEWFFLRSSNLKFSRLNISFSESSRSLARSQMVALCFNPSSSRYDPVLQSKFFDFCRSYMVEQICYAIYSIYHWKHDFQFQYSLFKTQSAEAKHPTDLPEDIFIPSNIPQIQPLLDSGLDIIFVFFRSKVAPNFIKIPYHLWCKIEIDFKNAINHRSLIAVTADVFDPILEFLLDLATTPFILFQFQQSTDLDM